MRLDETDDLVGRFREECEKAVGHRSLDRRRRLLDVRFGDLEEELVVHDVDEPRVESGEGSSSRASASSSASAADPETGVLSASGRPVAVRLGREVPHASAAGPDL